MKRGTQRHREDFPHMAKLKIAQVVSPWVTVPPEKYGGAELIVANLIEGLVENGHDVTLFASGDSKTKAHLVSVIASAPGLAKEALARVDNQMNTLETLLRAVELQKSFDVIHWHVSKDLAPMMLAAFVPKKSVVTFHNQFPTDRLDHLYKKYQNASYYVSISRAQRRVIPVTFQETVYNGIDVRSFTFQPNPGKYLVWIGRFSPYKGAHHAIRVALETDLPLKLAGSIPRPLYFSKEIKPHLGKKGIEYVGEVNHEKKNELLGGALALLNPIDWEESFGLVVPEANATGTPAVAYARGAMPELIQDGVNGLLVQPNDIEGLVQATLRIRELSRQKARRYVEQHFDVAAMVNGYMKVYKQLLS